MFLDDYLCNVFLENGVYDPPPCKCGDPGRLAEHTPLEQFNLPLDLLPEGAAMQLPDFFRCFSVHGLLRARLCVVTLASAVAASAAGLFRYDALAVTVCYV
jgi:hypothetical protein